MRTTSACLALLFILRLAVFAQGGQSARTIPIRISVDRQDHSIYYAIGSHAKLHLNDPKMTSQIMALGGATDKGSVLTFLIDNQAPLSELGIINYIVDKYDLNPARFFIYDYRSGQMTELKRDTDELFRWTEHQLPISESPPPEQAH